MGKRLIIKGADFSENALVLPDVLIKQGYTDGTKQLDAGWRYDSIPADKNLIIHKVTVNVPSVAKLDKTKASSLWLATYDGVNHKDGLSNIIQIDMTDVVANIVDNNRTTVTAGFTLTLPTPLAINAGEYFAYAAINNYAEETADTNNSAICYKSNADGTFGYIVDLHSHTQTTGGTNINWYGVDA